jgi:hypothetical protein
MSWDRLARPSPLDLTPPKKVQSCDGAGRDESARDAEDYPVVVALPIGL